ncbi:unnamed protein product [Bemisia tabaci]|uniref:Circadian clock-controlled protein n=1 Tax=Bemisia tabaci TaxID=7038 RepID=A0A9P0F2Q4_BEMTA|nr:unnamed protein product [Bemisia tabaci]
MMGARNPILMKSTMACALFSAISLSILLGASGKKVPDYLQLCKKNTPQYDQCTQNAIEAAKPYLAKGIPKMKVPPLEPLTIPQLIIDRNLEAIKVKAKLDNVTVFGCSNFDIQKLKINTDKLTLDISLLLPKLFVECEYDVDGRLLVIPLRGKGHFIGNMTNVKVDISGQGELTNVKGKEYVLIKKLKMKPRVGDTTVKFINDNKKNPENRLITETAANFINQNRRQVLDIVTPIAEETALEVGLQIISTIFSTVPFDELLPQ